LAKLYSSVACNLDAVLLSACYPLLEEARVEAIEWSFDALYKRNEIPDWFSELLHAYAQDGRLIAHGVFFSLFSGRWKQEQAAWLQLLHKTSREFQFDHVTEHFGFMTGKDFHHGAPLNIPYNATTLAIGKDRLARIQDACNAPVGLENLAFSYCLDDVKRHGSFLEQLITPVNGFIILDLHNMYCQLHNFSLDFETLIRLYPLDRVREIHISGGSWQPHNLAPGLNVRRDTHDDGVPKEVFEMLRMTIPLCPNLKFVVMEQLGTGLLSSESRALFYDDFVTMQQFVKACEQPMPSVESFLPAPCILPATPLSDERLHQQQLELSGILETATHLDDAMERLSLSSLAHGDWKVEDWQPYMLDAAIEIAKKWKRL
jgi:uncharacterized protein (UPF0276 family)